jgi:hypothetical protein
MANGLEVAEPIVHNTLPFEFSGMSKRQMPKQRKVEIGLLEPG